MSEAEIVSGKDLKNLRETLGLKLDDVHQVTKISPAVLEVIESVDGSAIKLITGCGSPFLDLLNDCFLVK